MYFCKKIKMKKRVILAFITLMLMPFLPKAQSSEEPERLQPKPMTSLSTVDECTQPEDSIAYYAIRNGDALIGYLMEPKDDIWSKMILSWILKDKRKNALRGITLNELREAEQQMVDILNAYVDSAQEVHRCFTPPRFYDHGRQYLFYTDSEEHQCLYVTFYDFHREPKYLCQLLAVCDGGDGFWQADFDLTARKLKWFDVNGPTIYMVPGRSKEPRGLRKKSRFYSGVYAPFNYIDEEELPEAAKTFCDQRMTKNLQRREDGLFCYDILNGPRAYFDSTGNFVASMAETWDKGIDMEEYFSSMMPALETMMNIMQLDLQRHDDEGQLNVFWVERIEGKWLIGAVMRKDYEFGTEAFYTFNDQGELVGVDRLRH